MLFGVVPIAWPPGAVHGRTLSFHFEYNLAMLDAAKAVVVLMMILVMMMVVDRL
jgi:hypothetical protein